eukprot:TRINITY_DN1228_c0_g1_i1.p1 TRINITY_DN1228_c0_g1~~TRINITY_DN1228_c0_g1_i1.p1  ORF type:complete len:270 (-),score=110.43 TRINITY_DN1228_c0_g1_i1:82-891(-)
MADLLAGFKEVTAKKYADQAQFFLNAFWPENGKDAEDVWKYWNKIVELDLDKKKEGCDLDEFNAHRFLESNGETKRVVELRETLRTIDRDFNKRMALIEFLLFRYKQEVKELMSRPQGSNEEELKKAQAKLNLVQAALEEVRKAEEAQRQAVAELKAEEDAYNTKLSTLEAKSKDATSPIVQRNKSAAELAQAKQEDPLPLRKAKISSEAALRKVEKQVREAQKAFDEAVAYLEEIKKGGGVAQGSIWWMERELKEAQKYLPKSKQTKI